MLRLFEVLGLFRSLPEEKRAAILARLRKEQAFLLNQRSRRRHHQEEKLVAKSTLRPDGS